MASGSAALAEPKIVKLNRPFFFMIVDSEFNMPVFMGVLNDVTWKANRIREWRRNITKSDIDDGETNKLQIPDTLSNSQLS